ncbi:PLP-dependent aminotransferase family protein [uncultured Parasutterella sp.]|jgi:GntR family transcriptional regulator of abcA and norABC|uniref:aminotransferase-like domain-containing protein n=1 Tax=uncultured Parasutterella sp. TaxID=1263098 RepID=UPI0025D88DFF|nr:PLP-dependent aminotransferase family protein [uncultured Parasutterella sp.]
MQDKESCKSNPAYRVIAKEIETEFRRGKFKAGDKLPSQRELMKRYRVSRNTMVAAISLLKHHGLIESHQRAGNFFRLPSQSIVDWNNYFKLSKHSETVISPFSRNYKSSRKVKNINLSGLILEAQDQFETKLRSVLDPSFQLFQTNFEGFDQQGLFSLREALVKYLAKFDIETTPEEILITEGPIQAISFIAESLIGNGIELYREFPSDSVYFKNIQLFGGHIHNLNGDSEGILLDKLGSSISLNPHRILSFYSCCQPPTNISISKQRRKQIYKFCSEHRIPIIDNCMLLEYCLDPDGPNPMKAIDKKNIVIHIGSFPKSVSPWIWLGWIVAPVPVIQKLIDVKEQRSRWSNPVNQKIVEMALRAGAIDDYFSALRSNLITKNKKYEEILRRYLSSVASWSKKHSGWCYWLEFNEKIDVRIIYKNCQGVHFNPGFFYDPSDQHHLMLNPPSVGIEEFETGIKQIRDLIDLLYPHLPKY